MLKESHLYSYNVNKASLMNCHKTEINSCYWGFIKLLQHCHTIGHRIGGSVPLASIIVSYATWHPSITYLLYVSFFPLLALCHSLLFVDPFVLFMIQGLSSNHIRRFLSRLSLSFVELNVCIYIVFGILYFIALCRHVDYYYDINSFII